MTKALMAAGLALLGWGAPAASEPVVLELSGTTLNGDGARWGGWIADVERPAPVTKVNKVDSFTIKQKAAEIGSGPSAIAPGAVAHRDKVELIPFNYQVESPRDVASGQASGKRGDEPLLLAKGSLVIGLVAPWPACAVGDRFNGAYLVSGTTHRYRFDGLQVVRCSIDRVAFNYDGVTPE